MKIRSGFVSNSSTTSFCIYGTSVEKEKFLQMIEKNEKVMAYLKESGLSLEESNFGDIVWAIEKHESPLEFHRLPDYDDYVYIGLGFDTLKDTETGAEFKSRVKQSIKEILGTTPDCGIIEEAWSNY